MAQGKVKWFNPDDSDESRPKLLLKWFGHMTGQASAAPEAATGQAAAPPANRMDPEIIGQVVTGRGDGQAIQSHQSH